MADVVRTLEGTAADETSQIIFVGILGVILLGLVGRGIRDLWAERHPLLFCLLLGGFLTSLLEPVTDVLTNIYILEGNAPGVFTLAGRELPIWAVAAHTVWWTLWTYLVYSLVRRGMPARRLAAVIGVVIVADIAMEVPLINAGLHEYWGVQPLMLFGSIPLIWPVLNVGGGVLAGTVIAMLPRVFAGWRVLLAIPLVPTLAGGYLWMAGWPFFVTITSNGIGGNPVPWIATVGGLATIMLSLAYMAIVVQVACGGRLVEATPAESRESHRSGGPGTPTASAVGAGAGAPAT